MKPHKTMASCHCSKIAGLLLLAVLMSIPAWGQQQCMVGIQPGNREVVETLSAGGGFTNAREEFLSPRPYNGWSVALIHDRMVNRGEDRFFQYGRSHHSILYSMMKNDQGGGSQMEAMIDVFHGWGHKIADFPAYEAMIGPAAMGSIGALYNLRNSNNPATAEGWLSMGFMADNTARFSLLHLPMAFQASLFLPLVGMGFAPDYDQLYWMMYSEKQYGRTLHFMYPGNAPTLYLDMALSVPVGRNQVRLGYSIDFTRNEWGGTYRQLSHSTFMLGLTHRFERKYNGR